MKGDDSLNKSIKYVFIFILLFTLVIKSPTTQADSNSAVVGDSSLNVRSGPGLSYGVIGSLKKNQKVTVLSTSGDWLEIKMDNGTGWIASWYTVNTEAVGSKIISNVNSLNVRSGPSINSSVIGQLNLGDEATYNNKNGDWAQIQINGQEGWVHTDYISIVTKDQKNTQSKPSTSEKTFTVAVGLFIPRNTYFRTSKSNKHNK